MKKKLYFTWVISVEAFKSKRQHTKTVKISKCVGKLNKKLENIVFISFNLYHENSGKK